MSMDHGCHVLVEKPLTVRLNGAGEIRDAANRADVVTAVSFNWRYAPGNLVAKRAIAEGRIGKILDVSAI
jgi:predicted dehydrogenase